MIFNFRGSNKFLSNFFISRSQITINGFTFNNAESAFQSFKCLDRQHEFQNLSPKQFKSLGRKVKLRDDWELMKDEIMYNILCCKFKDNHSLRQALLDTKDVHLIEGNNWGDTYWGVCKGVGCNKLGEILMQIREEIKNEN